MKAFARFDDEIWCMDLAYFDKLAKDNDGVKYVLVRQDLFDRTVGAKGTKRKDSKETVRAYLIMITKKNRTKKNWVDKGTELAGEFKKFCKAEGIQFYSTRRETKAAFAERTIQSLKNILYRYMEDKGYKYIHKLTQFFTALISRRNCSIDLIPKDVNISEFCPFCTAYNYENLENPNLKLEIEFASQSMSYRKCFKPQFTREVFEIVASSSRKPPTYTLKNEQDETIRGRFYQKELIKVIKQWIRLQ